MVRTCTAEQCVPSCIYTVQFCWRAQGTVQLFSWLLLRMLLTEGFVNSVYFAELIPDGAVPSSASCANYAASAGVAHQ